MPGGMDRPGRPPADRPPADRRPAERPAADQPAEGSGPDKPQDVLRQRLASLPANHPSSPWYRERRRERAARQDRLENGQEEGTERHSAWPRPDRSAEPGESGPTGVGRNRAAESGVSASGRSAEGRRTAEPQTAEGDAAAGERGVTARPQMTGEAAAIAARAGRDALAGRPEKQSKRRDRRDDEARGDQASDDQAWGNQAWGDQALWRLAASQHAAAEARRRERGGGTPIGPSGRPDPYQPWFADGTDSETWISAEETGEPWFTQEDSP
jgi:hypothetical protein